MSKTTGHIDWVIALSVVGLMLFSIAFVYSASASIAEARFGFADKFFWNHSLRVLAALAIMFVFAKIDYHTWERLSFTGIIIALLLLISVFFIGSPINNVYRWINFGLINFQPSEFAKFALILHLSVTMSERRELIRNFKLGFLPLITWTLLICGLIAIQPNFSTAIVIYIISFLLIFIGNANLLHLTGYGLLSGVAAMAYMLTASYRRQRILGYLGYGSGIETQNTDAANVQVNQALIAFGNGGLFGVGPGQSRQSHLFLPESYGDFIFSIIGEEYGFLGVLVLISVFLTIIWRGIRIVRRAPDISGYYLSSGIILTFAIYAITSAAVNCGLIPTTGLPMPFISYGGTAVLFYGAAFGALLNISAQANVFPRKDKSRI